MNCSFRDNISIEPITEVDWVDVVAVNMHALV